MVKELKEAKETNFWDQIKGKKACLTDIVELKFADITGKMTVRFVDADEVQDIKSKYDVKLPKKPIITREISGNKINIEVPNDDPKYKIFNNDPEAKKKIVAWEEKCRPIEKESIYRLAYEFLAEGDRPAGNLEQAVKFMIESLDYINAVKIVNAGMKLNNLAVQIEEAKNVS